MIRTLVPLAAAAAFAATMASADAASDACVERLRSEGGPDAANGVEVLNVDASQAGSVVTLRDAGMSVWECLGYADGTTEYLKVTDAMDDGEGAMAPAANDSSEGPEDDGATTTERVRFAKGTSGATYTGSLTPGSSARYVLDARKGQELRVRIITKSSDVSYQIFNPDSSFLFDTVGAETPYAGKLHQSGDQVIEIINRGDAADYGVEITVQ